MGEARRRGSYEQRKTEGIQRLEKERLEKEQLVAQRKQAIRAGRSSKSTVALAALLMTATLSLKL